MDAYTGNAADENQVREADSKVRRGRESEVGHCRAVMDTYSGRAFVNRYIRICGVFEDGFTGNNTTFYNEGKRSIGLRLLAELDESCPDLYFKMIEEAKLRAKKGQ